MSLVGSTEQVEFIRTVGAKRIYLVEMQPYILPSGPTDEIFICSEAYSDTEGDIYIPALMDDIILQKQLPENLLGSATISGGYVSVLNTAGDFDYWLTDRMWHGGVFKIYVIDPHNTVWDTRAEYLRIFVGFTSSVEQIRDDLLRVNFTAYGGQRNVDIFPHTYGTPVERTALHWGRIRNMTPTQVDGTNLKYDVHQTDLENIDAVYINGVGQTQSTDHGTESALDLPNTVTVGQYETCVSEGLFRLGSTPDALVTCDIKGPDNISMDANVEDLALFIGQPTQTAGVRNPYVLINLAKLAILKSKNSNDLGVLFTDATNVNVALDLVFKSVGAVWWYDNVGNAQPERFEAPGTSVGTLSTVVDVIGDVRIRPVVPTWRVEVKCQRNWTVQTGVPTSISDDRVQWLAREWTTKVAEDSNIVTQNPSAKLLQHEAYFDSTAAGQAEADRLLTLHKAQRCIHYVRSFGRPGGFDLNETWTLEHPRIAPNGKDMVIIGLKDSLLGNYTDLELWG